MLRLSDIVAGNLTVPVRLRSYPPGKMALHRQGMKEALHAGNDVLQAGGSALDAVVAAVYTLESEHRIPDQIENLQGASMLIYMLPRQPSLQRWKRCGLQHRRQARIRSQPGSRRTSTGQQYSSKSKRCSRDTAEDRQASCTSRERAIHGPYSMSSCICFGPRCRADRKGEGTRAGRRALL